MVDWNTGWTNFSSWSYYSVWFQFKKDSSTIGSVKADTVFIPNIADDAKRSREVICEELLPKFRDDEGFIKQINEIAKETEYRKRLSQESTYISAQTSETLIVSIQTMETKIVEQQQRIQEAEKTIEKLREQITFLHENRKTTHTKYSERKNDGPNL